MKNLRQKIMIPLVAGALAVGTFFGCGGVEETPSYSSQSQEEVEDSIRAESEKNMRTIGGGIRGVRGTYKFSEFGYLGEVIGKSITQMKTVDLDGDGDMDIIVGDSRGKIYIFENQIPQKRDSF